MVEVEFKLSSVWPMALLPKRLNCYLNKGKVSEQEPGDLPCDFGLVTIILTLDFLIVFL